MATLEEGGKKRDKKCKIMGEGGAGSEEEGTIDKIGQQLKEERMGTVSRRGN